MQLLLIIGSICGESAFLGAFHPTGNLILLVGGEPGGGQRGHLWRGRGCAGADVHLQRVVSPLLYRGNPLAAINLVPLSAILEHPSLQGVPGWLAWLSPLAGLAFCLVCLKIWHFGVRHYPPREVEDGVTLIICDMSSARGTLTVPRTLVQVRGGEKMKVDAQQQAKLGSLYSLLGTCLLEIGRSVSNIWEKNTPRVLTYWNVWSWI